MRPIKYGVADDHVKFKKELLQLLKAGGNAACVIDAKNGIDLLSKLDLVSPDIVLLSTRMHVVDGLEAARIIRKRFPLIKIIAFVEFDLEENIIELCKIGVKSIVPKNLLTDIVKIVSIVNEGGVYFPDGIAETLRSYLSRINNSQRCPANWQKTMSRC